MNESICEAMDVKLKMEVFEPFDISFLMLIWNSFCSMMRIILDDGAEIVT
jgi:hypothetical protein